MSRRSANDVLIAARQAHGENGFSVVGSHRHLAPCARATSRTIYNPRPSPAPLSSRSPCPSPRLSGSKIWFKISFSMAGPMFFTSIVTSVSLPVSTTRIRGHIRRSHTSHGPLTTHSVVFIESPVTLSNSGGTPFASTLVAMVQVSENHSC